MPIRRRQPPLPMLLNPGALADKNCRAKPSFAIRRRQAAYAKASSPVGYGRHGDFRFTQADSSTAIAVSATAGGAEGKSTYSRARCPCHAAYGGENRKEKGESRGQTDHGREGHTRARCPCHAAGGGESRKEKGESRGRWIVSGSGVNGQRTTSREQRLPRAAARGEGERTSPKSRTSLLSRCCSRRQAGEKLGVNAQQLSHKMLTKTCAPV